MPEPINHAGIARGGMSRGELLRDEIVGPGESLVTLVVNGRSHELLADPATTLADALRTGLGLTGTKIGCDRGACSACTVWLNGEPVASCMTFVLDAVDKQVTTIEGL